ncbi:hypothetical protein M885DRAFT_622275 [Pelagophyceae sp. CCMP2097]|nr:hypothetical protein M885DRAFT_622275 [Pelagophyceae sp. CCMP2097]
MASRVPRKDWDDDFTGAQKQPAPLTAHDEVLPELQTSWAPRQRPLRGGSLRLRSGPSDQLSLADPSPDDAAQRRISGVRSGAINYDAAAFLEGIRAYQPQAPRRSRRDAAADSEFDEWRDKWSYVHSFVNGKRARELEEAKRQATAAFGGAFPGGDFRPNLRGPPSAAPPYTQPSRYDQPASGRSYEQPARRGTDGCGDEGERRSVEDLPDYARRTEPRPAPMAARQQGPPRSLATWETLEAQIQALAPLGFDDIPWPPPGTSPTQIVAGDAATERKRKWHGALRRWHPDKFQRILVRVADAAARERIIDRVKEVTRRLIEEKAAVVD